MNKFIVLIISVFIILPIRTNGGINKDQVPVVKKSGILTLSLNKAINLALQANRNIITSQYNAEGKQFSLLSAQSDFELKIVPAASVGVGGGGSESGNDVNAGFSFQKKFEAGTRLSVGPNVNKSNGEYSTAMGLSVEQPILRGFGKDVNLDGIKSVDFSIQSSYRNIYQTKVNTVLETVAAFYEAVRQRETAGLYKSMGMRLSSHATVAKAKENVGLATPMDTYRAQIRLKDAEDSFTQAVEAYRDSLDRLKVILSLPLETEMEIEDVRTSEILNIELNNAIETALAHRIELEQAEADIKEAERRSAIMKHKILPEINLVFDYERFDSSDRFDRSAGLNQNRWGLRVRTSTDLSRTAEKSAYEQSILDLQTLQLNLEGKKDEFRRQVRKQLNSLKESGKRIDIIKEQIKQAEGKLALAEVKFAHEMADNFDVIEAETELQRARVNLLTAEIDYTVGAYNMRAVTGTLIERD